jgi:hypothetical protein
MVVPANSQPMFSMLDVVLMNHALGREPFQGFEATIYPGQYTLSRPLPKPFKDTGGGGSSFSGLAASQTPAEAPRSSAAARSLWPQLR